MQRNKEYPYCFGKLNNVFPMGADGLRHTPESCMVCLYKTECLRRAVQASGGLKIKEEQVDRAYSSGAISFLERWLKKKELHRRMKAREASERPEPDGRSEEPER